ncbi:hypothetical protein OCGS_0951 [Oceaniovalibus guishaninsula JLT2003]|uniref:DUF721 domain-containing protein n=1 Tax=Oceaniovalibus guishaninsula JLT2003 TaxID=1231392 RepID=K2GQG8_9RHOB|nr:DciA family protein [Oceaniovalibus guishaninsula]EKE44916.1 hypothetical protein OCGS_0951 [Oceaniovalibus guishaninsula JLT2003]
MTRPPHSPSGPAKRRGKRGFAQAASLVQTQIRQAGEARGFAVSRLLTRWAEIAGPDIAAIARPVAVGHARGAFGATLTLLTTGAQAPLLEMQKERLRERVNACYGYAAIRQIRITQTAATGFAEGAATFEPAPVAKPRPDDPHIVARARTVAAPVTDPGLRAALERLGSHVLNSQKQG